MTTPESYIGRQIDLLTSTKPRFVMPAMFGSSSNFKIFNSIIIMIMILMMNYLVWFEFPTSILFKNKTMTLTFPARVIERRAIYKLSMAITRAENIFSFLMRFIVTEFLTTLLTLKNALSRFIVTNSITEPSSLRWWSREFRPTNFTDILHIFYYSTQCKEVKL